MAQLVPMLPPPHLAELELGRAPIRFRDLAPRNRPIHPDLDEALLQTSPRGVLALTAAMAEWALWRVDGQHESDTSALIAAMWAVAVHPSYLAPFRLDELPPASDPGWANPAQSAVWHVQRLHRRVVEGMIGYAEVQELRHWCLHVLPKPVRERFDDWLIETATMIAMLAQATPETFTTCTEQRPDPETQRALVWGRAFTRDEFACDLLDDEARVASLDAFLRSLDPASNPYLCPREQVAANRCWRGFTDEIPGLTGEPYRFTGDE